MSGTAVVRPLLLAVAAGLLLAAAYRPAMQGHFLMSDQRMLVENPRLTEPGGLASLWSPSPSDAWPPLDQYQPLSYSALWLERQLWGLRAVGYQAVSLLLHALAAFLALRVLTRVGARGAALAAALYALHPVQVESVAWIYEQKNVLSGACFFASLWTWLRFAEAGRARWYALSLAAFAAALLAKSSTVMLPVLIAVHVALRPGGGRRRRLLLTLPFFALSAALAGITVWYEGAVVGAGGAHFDAGLLERGARAGWVLVLHLEKLLLPQRLAFFYPGLALDPADPRAWLPDLAILALFAALWRWRRGWGGPALLGLGYYVVVMFPVLGFFDIYYHQFSLVADHFQYLAALGPIALAVHGGAAALARLRAPRAVRRALAAGALACAWLLTYGRSQVFASDLALARDAVSRYPDAWLAQSKTGELLLEQVMQGTGGERELRRATEHLERAVASRPDEPRSVNSLGVAYTLLGRTDAGLRQLRRSIELEPGNATLLGNLAAALDALPAGRALVESRAVVRAVPESPAERLLLARTLLRAGRRDEALREIDAVTRLAASQPEGAPWLREAERMRRDLASRPAP